MNRLEIEIPSSASSPRPVLARASMMAASSGRLATSTRPSSRSYHRNAGTPSEVPIRSACWLAGVVQGSCTVHGSRLCEPASTQRRSVGMLPDCSAQRMTGCDTPSSWTNSTPSTSGSGTSVGLVRSSAAANDSSVPALTSQVRKVPNAAASQEASTTVQNES